MIPHIVQASYVSGYTLGLQFSDGAEGEVDLGAELHGEVFEPLKEVQAFQAFEVNPELTTVVWANGADFTPEFLRASEGCRLTSHRADVLEPASPACGRRSCRTLLPQGGRLSAREQQVGLWQSSALCAPS